MAPKKKSLAVRSKRQKPSPRTRAAQPRTRSARSISASIDSRNNHSNDDLAEDELTALVIRGCLIARDAVFNVKDYLSDGSRLAFLAIKDCEKELDQI